MNAVQNKQRLAHS